MRAAELLARSASNHQASIGDLEVFCPTVRKAIQVGGHRRLVFAALFPGYFLGRFHLESAARFVSSRPGIIGLVRFGGTATSVPDKAVAEMQTTEFTDCAEAALMCTSFIAGQSLLIREGPFAGLEAEFVASMNDGKRALLLLEYLHQRVNVVADLSLLDLAS